MAFLPAASRRRAEFKLLEENKKWSLAYMGIRSHNKVAISTCLILEPSLQKILPLVQEMLGSMTFISNIETVSITSADCGIEVIFSLNKNAKLPGQPKIVETELKHIADTIKLARTSITDSNMLPLATVEKGAITMRLGNIDMKLPHDAFLQATSEGQRLLTEFAIKNMEGQKRVVDMFCGIGTYSVPLARNAMVHAIDDHAVMINNLKAAKISGLSAEKRNLFTEPLKPAELDKFDAAVINPPRLGAKAQCEQIALSAIKQVVMISCNPATFARDAKILGNAGFSLKDTLTIDQFVWSPHLEIAASFVR